MTSEHQVALARAHRMSAPSNHMSRTARQVVPAFLQKLYELRTVFWSFNSYGMLTYHTTPVMLSSFVGLMFGILLRCVSFTFYLHQLLINHPSNSPRSRPLCTRSSWQMLQHRNFSSFVHQGSRRSPKYILFSFFFLFSAILMYIYKWIDWSYATTVIPNRRNDYNESILLPFKTGTMTDDCICYLSTFH